MIRLAVCLALSILSACASAPSAQELAAANLGPMPDRADACRVAEAYLTPRLRDPNSVVYSWGDVRRDSYKLPLSRPVPCWEISGTVNAKNAFGGYVGATGIAAHFIDGQLVAFTQNEPQGRFSICERVDPVAVRTSPTIAAK